MIAWSTIGYQTDFVARLPSCIHGWLSMRRCLLLCILILNAKALSGYSIVVLKTKKNSTMSLTSHGWVGSQIVGGLAVISAYAGISRNSGGRIARLCALRGGGFLLSETHRYSRSRKCETPTIKSQNSINGPYARLFVEATALYTSMVRRICARPSWKDQCIAIAEVLPRYSVPSGYPSRPYCSCSCNTVRSVPYDWCGIKFGAIFHVPFKTAFLMSKGEWGNGSRLFLIVGNDGGCCNLEKLIILLCYVK